MLLFSFNMTDDPLTTDASAFIGSRLDILLVKVNGAIYYESSTHMDGLKSRILQAGRHFRVHPHQVVYVTHPASHVANASADITSDISQLTYVAEQIPAHLVREGVAWDVPLDLLRHLPTITEM